MVKYLAMSAALALAGLSAASADSVPLSETATTGHVNMWAPTAGDEIRFNVLRKSNPFGSHVVTFDEAADGALLVSTNVELRAGLGPITVFKYELESREIWRDGELVALSGTLNDDGSKGSVSAVAEGGQLVVDGTKFEGAVDLGILPSSHWNVRQASAARLVSTEDGEILDVQVSELGRETLNIAGQPINATRYLLDSDIDVELWYDDSGRWVKLAFEARGQAIEYVLDALY